MVEKNKRNNIKYEVKLPSEINAPIKKGDKVGDITFTLDGEVLGTCPITAAENVNKKSFTRTYLDVLVKWLR